MRLKRGKKNFIIMISVILAVILLLILGLKLYAKNQINLSIDEKTYYVHQNTSFDIPQATASDQSNEEINIEITIYKDGKKVDSIDTNHVGDIYKVYYKASKGMLSIKKYITVKVIANENLLKYDISGISNEWTNQDVTLTFVPKDDNIKEYCFDGKCTSSKEVKVTKNGSYNTYIVDDYGNKSEEKTYQITNIDKIVPTIVKVSEYTKNNKIYLGVTATDDASGVKMYSFDNGKTYSEESTIKVTKDITIKVIVKDAAGNESKIFTYNYVVATTDNPVNNETEEEIPVDTTAPTFTLSKSPSTEWSNSNVTVTVNATDDMSGVKTYSFDNGSTWQTENTKEYTASADIKVRVKDNAGNISNYEELSIKIDKVAPVITNIINETTYTEAVTFEVVEDNVDSQVLKKDGTEITFVTTVDENGSYSVIVTDKAGNTTTIIFTVSIDEEAPTFTLSKSPSTEWSNSNVTVTVNANDDISGVKEYSFDNGSTWQTSNTKEYEATADIKVKVKDNMDNVSDYQELSIKIDKVAPVITNIINETTYTEAVTFEVVEDNVDSQVLKKDGTEITFVTTVDENGSYSVIVTDKAGNTTTVIFTVSIETNPELGSLSITGAEDGEYYNNNVTLNATSDGTITTVRLNKASTSLITESIYESDNSFTKVSYTLGNSISEEGTYTLYVEDDNNNNAQVTFTIDKTDPEVLSELAIANDDTILTARDYSLDTVTLYKDDDVDKCFATEETTKDGEDCEVTDYYNMNIYQMLEYSFAADGDALYTVIAEDKAGNETTYDMDSDIIPIYTIADLEAIGSNATRTINDKDYFMSSTGSYRLMNDLDYENTRYNQIGAGYLANDDSEGYYTGEWTEVTEEIVDLGDFTLDNLALANIEFIETTEGEIDHVEVTIGAVTYVNFDIHNEYDLFGGDAVEFNKEKVDGNYVDLTNPVIMACGQVMSETGGILCNVETDSSKKFPETYFNIFGSDFYTVSTVEGVTTYAVSVPMYDEGTEEDIIMTFYFKVNASDGSLIEVLDEEDNDITSEMVDVEMISFAKLYERNVDGSDYLIYAFSLTLIEVECKENKTITVPKDGITTDGSYIYFISDDGTNFKVEETEFTGYYDYLIEYGKEYFDKYRVWSCTVDCTDDDNWERLSTKEWDGYLHMRLYEKQNWSISRICSNLADNNGRICGRKYFGYGYGDGDINQSNFYADKYGRYVIFKHENNWYKVEYSNEYNVGRHTYIFDRTANQWEETDDLQLYYFVKDLNPELSISFEGNNHTISNITNSSTNSSASYDNQTGLFYNLNYGTIKNLTFTNAKLYDRSINYSELEHFGLLANKITNSNIKNITIQNSNIYPDAHTYLGNIQNRMGIIAGISHESQILNNTINSTTINAKVSVSSELTKMGGLIGESRNSNIIGNTLDITNHYENTAGLVYYIEARNEYDHDTLSNVYNSYISNNTVKYRNQPGIIFNLIYQELYEQDSNYKVHFANNTLDIADIE